MTKIIKIDRKNYERDQIIDAAEALRSGGTVVFPTETVYGLGALAEDGEACKKIFVAKGRPSDNPLIVHISNMDQFRRYSKSVDAAVFKGLEDLWPGPLTVVVFKGNDIPDVVTAALPTVAVRMPDDNIARDLIDMSGPIAAPSANLSTKPSITDSKDAIRFLDGRVDVIIDAGPTRYGIESTIIDVTKKPMELLRPGAFALEDLEPFFGRITYGPVARGLGEAKVAITPGMKYRHYAPKTPLFLTSSRDLFRDIVPMMEENSVAIGTEELVGGIPNAIILGTDSDLYSVAHNLFSALIKLDDIHADYAVIHPFDEKGIGLAIMNRIRKASQGTLSSVDEFMFIERRITQR